jgi:hypothetical protein
MAQTEKQWNEFQASLPAEERVSYLDYLKIAEPVKYDNLSGATLARLKADSLEVKATAIVDESTKIAGAKTDTAAQKAAAVNAANALARLKAAEASFNVTTKAPVITTAGPILTTAGPVLTTAGPVLTTAGPNVVLTTAGPNVVLTTAGPGVVTTAGPGVVTTAGPNVVTTAGPGVVTTAGTVVTTSGPNIVTTKAPSGFTYTATDGTPFTDQAVYLQYQKMLNETSMAKKATDAASAAERQSAYDLLYAQFSAYGLGSLVEPLRGLIQSGSSPAEFTIKLRESDAYQRRFAGNKQRISKGLKAISEAEYIGLEDQYQNILRNAGLPESYWKQTVDPVTGIKLQEGFTNFIANDVSAVELEDRVSTAQQRLIYANPEVSIALKNFYPDISNGDLLAYALDPTKGLEQIKRRITAAEIGSSAVQLGLTTNVTDAEYLARYGVNKAQAQQGYRTAAEILPTASKLGEIYSKQGLGAYTQQTAEQEIFNVPGAAEAAAKRRKLSELETAAFSGKSGMGALARDRAGAF